MKRSLEPELMESTEQAAAYAAADFAAVNQAFVDRFTIAFPEVGQGRMVDLGCGDADIAVRLARGRPRLEIVAIDGSQAMLEQGRRRVDQAKVDDRVTLELRRLPLSDHPRAPFSAGISNSLLHHLHEPSGLWTTLLDLLAPGAPVQVVDLRRPASEDMARALVDQHARDEHPILRDDFFNSLKAAFTLDEVREQLQVCGLGEWTVEPIGDRHLGVQGRIP